MKNMRIILLLSVCFLMATFTASALAKDGQAADGDGGGALKIQTDVLNEDDALTDDAEVKPEKNKVKEKARVVEGEEIPGGDRKVAEEVDVDPELFGDFAEMAKVAKLDKPQQAQLLKVQKERELALDKWDRKWNPRIDKAQGMIDRTENKHKRVKLEKQLAKLLQNRKRLAERADLKALRVLKPHQVLAWNTEQLWWCVEKEFADLDLADTQAAKMKVLCGKIAKRVKGKRDVSSQKHLQKLTVNESIKLLSKQQRREYKRAKAEQKRNEIREREEEEKRDDKKSKVKRGRGNR